MYKTISSQSLPVIKSEKVSNSKFESNNLDNYEILKKRKEALEEALNIKLLQLKSLCFKEADITGELPVETPLDPEERIPQVRKRIGAEFNLNQSLLSKSKSMEEETLDKLEIEFELQRKIVKANFKLSNENNIKKSVRKQRTQNYHEAILKLKALEKKLIDMRVKMDQKDGVDSSSSKVNHIKSDSDFNLDQLSFIDQQSKCSDEINDEENAISSAFNQCSTSAPATPVKFRKPHRLPRPVSPSFKPISPPSKRSSVRPSTAHTSEANSKANPSQVNSLRIKTAHNIAYDLDIDSSSIGSSSSCDSNLVKTINDKKRKNILSLLQTPLSNESLNLISSHTYALPTKRTSVSSNDDSISKLLINDTGLPEASSKLYRSESDTLTRHDSLDNSRRKSYISAIQYLPANFNHSHLNHHRHYHNHTPLSRNSESHSSSQSSVLTATGATSTSALNMAQRPLPPPPSSPVNTLPPFPPTSNPTSKDKCSSSSASSASSSASSSSSSSSSSSTSTSANHKVKSELYQNVSELNKTSLDIKHDISLRAVRSSIIRTPVAITISTTTSSDASANIKPPTPAPSLPPRSSTNNLQLKAEQQFFGQTPKMFNFDTTTISRYSVPKTWTETAIDQVSVQAGIETNETDQASCTSSKPTENCTPQSEFTQPRSRGLCDDADEVDSASDKQSKRGSISSKSTENLSPRPITIPMSPTLPAFGNGVEVNVVSVGHFQPYREEIKPYELSDFYKYSTKHRKIAGPASKPPMPPPPPLPSTSSSSASMASTVHDSEESKINVVKGKERFKKDDLKLNPTAKPSELPTDSNLSEITFSMSDESFISKTAVSAAFREEMLDWYENEVKKPTLV